MLRVAGLHAFTDRGYSGIKFRVRVCQPELLLQEVVAHARDLGLVREGDEGRISLLECDPTIPNNASDRLVVGIRRMFFDILSPILSHTSLSYSLYYGRAPRHWGPDPSWTIGILPRI